MGAIGDVMADSGVLNSVPFSHVPTVGEPAFPDL